MKKLIIAFAAVAMATVASAATVKWTGANIYEPGTTTKASGYLVYFVSSADYALTSAQADLTAQKTDFITSYGQAPATTGSTGTASATITTEAGNGESWTGYLVILNAGTLADATYAYLTPEATKATGGTGQAANLAFTANTGTQTASNWYAVGSVPEPTSGLMLLLGVAGLALKRKRA